MIRENSEHKKGNVRFKEKKQFEKKCMFSCHISLRMRIMLCSFFFHSRQ